MKKRAATPRTDTDEHITPPDRILDRHPDIDRPSRKRVHLPPDLSDERIVEVRELGERLTLDRTTLWRMVQSRQFPPPIRLTRSRIGWRWSTVLAWLAEREAHPVGRRAYFGTNKENPHAAERP